MCTLKYTNRKFIATYRRQAYEFSTLMKALKFIDKVTKEENNNDL